MSATASPKRGRAPKDAPPRQCPHCEEMFKPTGLTQKYCGKDCRLAAMAARNTVEIDRAKRGAAAGGAATQAKYADFQSTKTYKKHDGQAQHRVVAEIVLGRALTDTEVVHHEDKNKRNNHPRNLIVFPDQAGHARHHGQGHLGQPCDCECIRLWEVI